MKGLHVTHTTSEVVVTTTSELVASELVASLTRVCGHTHWKDAVTMVMEKEEEMVMEEEQWRGCQHHAKIILTQYRIMNKFYVWIKYLGI